MKKATIQQLEVTANAAFEHIAVQQAHLDEAREDYEKSVASGDDDLLEEQELAIAHYSNLVQRAERRHAALLAEIEAAKGAADRESGDAAQDEADSKLAELQTLLDAAAVHAAKLAEIASKAKPLLDQANERRRWVKHYGVPLSRPTLKAPDFGPALEAARALACLPAAVWTNLYG